MTYSLDSKRRGEIVHRFHPKDHHLIPGYDCGMCPRCTEKVYPQVRTYLYERWRLPDFEGSLLYPELFPKNPRSLKMTLSIEESPFKDGDK